MSDICSYRQFIYNYSHELSIKGTVIFLRYYNLITCPLSLTDFAISHLVVEVTLCYN